MPFSMICVSPILTIILAFDEWVLVNGGIDGPVREAVYISDIYLRIL